MSDKRLALVLLAAALLLRLLLPPSAELRQSVSAFLGAEETAVQTLCRRMGGTED